MRTFSTYVPDPPRPGPIPPEPWPQPPVPEPVPPEPVPIWTPRQAPRRPAPLRTGLDPGPGRAGAPRGRVKGDDGATRGHRGRTACSKRSRVGRPGRFRWTCV